jgi:hypothetical protein
MKWGNKGTTGNEEGVPAFPLVPSAPFSRQIEQKRV